MMVERISGSYLREDGFNTPVLRRGIRRGGDDVYLARFRTVEDDHTHPSSMRPEAPAVRRARSRAFPHHLASSPPRL